MLELSAIATIKSLSIEQKIYANSSLIGITHGLLDMVIQYKLRTDIFISFQKFESFLVEYDRFKILDGLCKKVFVFARNINADIIKDFKNTIFIELDEDDSMMDEWNVIVNHPEHPVVFLNKEIFYTKSSKEDQFRKFNGFLSFSSNVIKESLKVINTKLKRYGIDYNSLSINYKKSDKDDILIRKMNYFLNRTLSEIQDRNFQLIKKNEKITSLYNKVELSQTKIKYLAYHDHLTGLPNRLFLSEQLNHAISLSGRNRKMLAIMFLDLDDFKIINDSMGHDIGDLLLVKVSKTLVNTLRKCDIVSRIGGDEFVILIEDLEDIANISIVAEKILKRFNKPFKINNQDCFVTTSIGIAIYPPNGETAEVLMKNADIAMYKAKDKGKNKYVLSTPIIKTTVIKALSFAP